MTRSFHIGDVLSVTTGRLLSPRHVAGLYDLLGYMTGDDPMSHQLPRFAEECAPELLAQHPQLASVDASVVTSENWREWLAERAVEHGSYLEVRPLTDGVHLCVDPVAEAAAMVGEDRVIPVVVEPEEGGEG